MLVNMTCPRCGAQMEVDSTTEFIFCQFCGTQIMNVPQRYDINQTLNIVQHIDRSNEPNLFISYASVNPSVLMVTRIAETGQRATYVNGQTLTFHLSPGKYVVVLKIGRINYNRTIYIPEDNTPVRINASFSGRANIWIDQPPYTVSTLDHQMMNSSSSYSQMQDTAPALKKSPWSIVAFVLSFLFYTSPIAVVLGILDLSVFKRQDRNHKLSIAAIAIGTSISLLYIPLICSCSSWNSSYSKLTDYSNASTGYYQSLERDNLGGYDVLH